MIIELLKHVGEEFFYYKMYLLAKVCRSLNSFNTEGPIAVVAENTGVHIGIACVGTVPVSAEAGIGAVVSEVGTCRRGDKR